MSKRYYWMKLKESFMTSDTVDFLMSQKNGANYVVLYQMLCLKSINTGGKLVRELGEVIIPFDVPKIQRDCKYFDTDTIIVALQLFTKLGLIYEDTDGIMAIADYDELVGSETDSAARMRALRKREQESLPEGQENPEEEVEKIPSQCDTECAHNVAQNVTLDIDIRDRYIDKDIDILDDHQKEKEINKEKEKVRNRFGCLKESDIAMIGMIIDELSADELSKIKARCKDYEYLIALTAQRIRKRERQDPVRDMYAYLIATGKQEGVIEDES